MHLIFLIAQSKNQLTKPIFGTLNPEKILQLSTKFGENQ